MSIGTLISTEEFCTHYSVDPSFIHSLQDQGLIRIHIKDNLHFVDTEELKEIEKFIRLHFELDINIEGIDAISNLLQKMNEMQEEIILLRNKLSIYEGGNLS